MANPATWLTGVFANWESELRSSQPYEWNEDRAHREAADVLSGISSVREILEGRSKAGLGELHATEMLDDWVALAFAYAAHTATPTAARAAKHAAAGIAAAIGRDIPEIDEAERDELFEIAAELISEVEKSNDFPMEMKVHLFEVATHVRNVVEKWEVIGTFELQRAVEQLTGALVATLPQAQATERGWIMSITRKLGTWLMKAVDDSRQELTTELIQKALGS